MTLIPPLPYFSWRSGSVPDDPATRIKKQLDQAEADHGYIPLETLRQICGVTQIREVLGVDEERAAKVQNEALRLFAVLILVQIPKVLLQLPDQEHLDRYFFAATKERPYCSRNKLELFPQFNRHRNEMYDKQWLIPPPFSDEVHQIYPKDFQPQRFCKDGQFRTVGDTNGRVEIADMAGELLNEPAPIIRVAYKQTWPDRNRSWHRVITELQVMRSRKHDHLLRLYATFEVAGTQTDSDPQANSRLYMILEYASGGTLHDWMRERSPPLTPTGFDWENQHIRQEYLIGVMESLVSALASLHRPVDDFVVCHFDLKPRNILLVHSSQGPVWKIADFGHAESIYLPRQMDYRIEDLRSDYAPPEFYSEKRHYRLARHGPEYDVWSLGCIFSELATTVAYGWQSFNEVQGYENRRLANDGRDSSFQANPSTVQAQLEQVRMVVESRTNRKDDGRQEYSDFVRLLRIIETMMAENRAHRPFAFEVAIRLYDLSCPESRSSRNLLRRRQRIEELIRQPIDDYDTPLDNPLTRAKAIEPDDAVLIGILEEFGWGDDVRCWRTYCRVSGLSNAIHHVGLEFSEDTPIPRKHYMAQINQAFDAPHVRNKPRKLSLFGLGGAGKSQIAWTYTKACREEEVLGTNRSRKRPKHCFWLNSGQKDTLERDCKQICSKIRSSTGDLESQDDSFQTLSLWLQNPRNEPWLLVIDGLNDEDLAQWLAAELNVVNRGHVLITTRNNRVSESFNVPPDTAIRVEQLSHQEALALLRRPTGPLSKQVCSDQSDSLNELIQRIGLRLPPVIQKLAKYLRNSATDPVRLIKWIEADLDESFIRSLGLMGVPGDYLYSLVLRNYVEGQSRSELETSLLLLCSCYHHTVDYDLLVRYANRKLPMEDPMDVMDYPDLTMTLNTLCSHCLLERAHPDRTSALGNFQFDMDPSIQRCVLAYFAASESPSHVLGGFDLMLQTLWAKYKLDLKAAAVREGTPIIRNPRRFKKRFMPHFRRFKEQVEEIQRRKSEGNYSSFQFTAIAVHSILEFCQPLSENQFDPDGQESVVQLLKFVKNQGISAGEDPYRRKRATVDMILELSRYYRLRKDRKLQSKEHLTAALDYAREAYQFAHQHEMPAKEWQAMDEKCFVLIAQRLLSEAEELIQSMDQFARNHPSVILEPYNLDLHRVDVFVHKSEQEIDLSRRRETLIEARERCIRTIEKIRQHPNKGQRQRLAAMMSCLARVDIEIPCQDTLDEALAILEARYGPKDPRTREVALFLRTIFHHTGKFDDRDELIGRLKMKPVNESNFSLNRWSPWSDSDLQGWPDRWERGFKTEDSGIFQDEEELTDES